MDKGKGKETETRNKTRRTEKMVVAQQACELLYSQGSHMEIRGNEAVVAFCILSDLDKARLGYLYYNGYSMHEVSKKKEKIK